MELTKNHVQNTELGFYKYEKLKTESSTLLQKTTTTMCWITVREIEESPLSTSQLLVMQVPRSR
jgi:hypothetical protein